MMTLLTLSSTRNDENLQVSFLNCFASHEKAIDILDEIKGRLYDNTKKAKEGKENGE